MNHTKLITIIILSFSLFSCHSGNDKQKQNVANQTKDTIVTAAKENFPKGEIIENIVCKSDATQSYVLYLPKNYSIDKTYPVVYALDAHGTGKLPVSMYKDLAEQYGYILIGSNNSKNGNSWEESTSIAEKLFADSQNRLSINNQRIYLLGFSGGARVANGIAITNGAIEGVICCGAAAPGTNSENPRSNYTWLGIAGEDDFNSVEMRKYDMLDLAGHNVKHALITFEGKHEWCPKEVMDEAFWWLELCEMRKDVKLKNDSLIKKRITPAIKQIETLMKKNELYDAFILTKKTINFYEGLADLTYCFSVYKSLQTNSDVDKGLKAEEASWRKDGELQQYYVKGFQTFDLERWKKEIAMLNGKTKAGGNKTEIHIYKRTLGYLSLVAYMQASGALKQNELPAAEYFCNVYALIDPTNSEAYYLAASVNAKQGNEKGFADNLNKAAKNGFKDKERFESDTVFNKYKNTAGYIEFEKMMGAK